MFKRFLRWRRERREAAQDRDYIIEQISKWCDENHLDSKFIMRRLEVECDSKIMGRLLDMNHLHYMVPKNNHTLDCLGVESSWRGCKLRPTKRQEVRDEEVFGFNVAGDFRQYKFRLGKVRYYDVSIWKFEDGWSVNVEKGGKFFDSSIGCYGAFPERRVTLLNRVLS